MSKRTGKDQAAKASSSDDRLLPTSSPDMSGVMEAIATLEQKILARIDLSTKDLNEKIGSIKSVLADQEGRLQEVETGLNEYSDRTVTVEGDVSQLKLQVAKLTQKLDDLEGRQRRSNARIVGVKEGYEDSGKPTDVFAAMLKELFGLGFVPTLDRAHRSLRPQPKDGEPPRVVVVKFHYFQEREEVFRKASLAPALLQGKKISIFPDYTTDVAKRRASFAEAKRLLRSCKDVRFGLLYPAVLRITTSAGQEKRFTDPSDATDYVKKELLR